MASMSPDCAKRMTVWLILAVGVIVIILVGGYGLFEAPGHGPAVQQKAHSPADQK